MLVELRRPLREPAGRLCAPQGRVHRGPDVAVVTVTIAAVEDHHHGRAQIGDQSLQDRRHCRHGRRAQRARRGLAVEAGVAVPQQLYPGCREPARRPVQLRLADGTEVVRASRPGGRLAGFARVAHATVTSGPGPRPAR